MSKANSVFQKWLKKQSAEKATEPVVKAGQKTDFFPLSPEQMRLWALAQLHSDNPVYNFIVAFSFQGEIDAERLSKAYELVLLTTLSPLQALLFPCILF